MVPSRKHIYHLICHVYIIKLVFTGVYIIFLILINGKEVLTCTQNQNYLNYQIVSNDIFSFCYFLIIAYFYHCKKTQVGKDQEKAQSEKDSHPKIRGGKN